MAVRQRTWTTSKGEPRTSWIVDYADREGKRHIETFTKKGDARERWHEIEGEKRAGTHVARSASSTVAEAGERWIEHARLENLEPTTIEQYDQHVRHINPILGHKKLADLSHRDVDDFEVTLANNGFSEAMRRKLIVSLGSLIAAAGEGRNVVRERGRRRRKRDKRKLEVGVDIPTPQEVSRLLNTAAGRFRPILITAAYTGMRASELRGLRWCDVDFERHTIHVRQRADRHGAIGKPKSDAGTRTIPVGPFVMNSLREWKKDCEEGELDLVFPGKDGGVQTYIMMRRRLISLMKTAGVVAPDGKPKYSGLHSLRHFYASWLMNRKEAGGRGLQPQEAQKRMGHATMAMTVDTYGHLFPRDEDLAEIAAAEDALLSLAAG